MKPQRFYDREKLTYDEKADICRKSDNRCCHCGEIKFLGYGATIDHFVPLNKGGSNQSLNLIMLCEDCNHEKDNKLVDVSYIPYLKEPYKTQLHDYVTNYAGLFDYLSRNRLFMFDEYEISLNCTPNNKYIKNKNAFCIKYKIKLATWNDYDKICAYYESYARKYGHFYSKEAVEQQISFWMAFGSIYYIERKGQISVMTACTIRHVLPAFRYHGIPYELNMYIFSLYTNDNSYSLAFNAVSHLPSFIMKEQDLACLPITINMLADDKMSFYVYSNFPNHKPYKAENEFFSCISASIVKDNSNFATLEQKEVDKVHNFMKKFDNITDKIKQYFIDYANDYSSWQIYDILNIEDIHNTEEFTQNKEFYKYNSLLLDNYYKVMMGAITNGNSKPD